MEILGAAFSIMGALRLTANLFSSGWKMYKGYRKGSKARPMIKGNIRVGVEDDVDDYVSVTNPELMAAGVSLVLQVKNSSEPRRQPQSKTKPSSTHAAKRIVAQTLVGRRSDLKQLGKSPEEAGQVEESSNGYCCAVVDGLEGVRYAVSDGSLLLNETLKEVRGMRGDITQAGKNSQDISKEMKRMEEILLQFHSESERQYEVLSSKLSDTNRDARDISNKLDHIQEGVERLQDSPLDLALCYIDEFKASKGEELEYLDKAYHRSMEALTTTNYSSLDAVFAASTIAVSTSYTWRAKRNSPAEAKKRVFDGTFKIIIRKLEPYWETEFANITTKGLKAVEFLLDIASFISLLPPKNVVLPPLNHDLVQVFGRLCVLKPEMLQRYPELAEAARASFLLTSLGTLPQNKDNFGPDVVQSLLDSEKPRMSDTVNVSRPEPELPGAEACRRPYKSRVNVYMENLIGLPEDNSVLYDHAEKGLLSNLKMISNQWLSGKIPLDKKICNHAAKGGQREVLKWLRDNRCPWDSETCAAAAYGGHLDLLQWAHANRCPWNETTCSAAAYGGYLNVLKWARENGCPWDEKTCAAAALGGHLKVLQWARENKCPWNDDVCFMAAFNGHIEVLKWARGEKSPWDKLVCSMAALGGHLETLQWAKTNGCPWNEETCSGAVHGGHWEILQWARANGCPSDKETCEEAAKKGFRNIA